MLGSFLFFFNLSDEVEKLTSRTFSDVTNTTAQGENQPSVCNGTLAESSALAEEGLFFRKRFLLLGFGEEDESCIADIIKENAGEVVPPQGRAIADYAVVPLLGCTVKATVGDVVTNTWLVRELALLQFPNKQVSVLEICLVRMQLLMA